MTKSSAEKVRAWRALNRERANETARRSMAKWRKANPEAHRRRSREWQIKNPERVRANLREWKHRRRAWIMEQFEEWEAKNPTATSERNAARIEARKAKRRQRYRDDRSHRLVVISRIYCKQLLCGQPCGGSVTAKLLEAFGCSLDELVRIVESKWLPGMTWENHTHDGWHLDHVRPASSFDLTDPEQFRQCWHHSNLQPLWAFDNLSKKDKW